MHACMHVCMYVCMLYVCMYVYTHTCTHMYLCVYMYIYILTYLCTHTHIHTHTHTHTRARAHTHTSLTFAFSTIGSWLSVVTNEWFGNTRAIVVVGSPGPAPTSRILPPAGMFACTSCATFFQAGSLTPANRRWSDNDQLRHSHRGFRGAPTCVSPQCGSGGE